MRHPIIWAILFYQWIAPASIRRRCIFAESCSNYVLEGARKSGTFEAIRRFRRRFRSCRPGYTQIDTSMSAHKNLLLVRLADGMVVEGGELSDRLKEEFDLEPTDRRDIYPSSRN